MEALSSSDTSIPIKAELRNVTEDDILQSHRRGNFTTNRLQNIHIIQFNSIQLFIIYVLSQQL
jgi:hypothetical protein